MLQLLKQGPYVFIVYLYQAQNCPIELGNKNLIHVKWLRTLCLIYVYRQVQVEHHVTA